MFRSRINRCMVWVVICGLFMSIAGAGAGNIDPYNTGQKYGWGENVGWLNFRPFTGNGAQISSARLVGWVWAENIGWVCLSCLTTSSCRTADYGVVNDGNGNLSGYAWGENVGWINFNPVVAGDTTHYGVRVNPQGYFYGWAWGENIGWVRFDSAWSYDARACIVGLEDLVHFASYWLQSGPVPGELDGVNGVNMGDFARFALYYLDYCPDGWQLN